MALSFTIRQKQAALWVSVGILFVALLILLGPILTPFIAGGILAYALNPAVNRLRSIRVGRFRLSRPVSVVLVMVLLLAIITALGLILIPLLQQELPLLQEQIPILFIKLNQLLSPIFHEIGADVQLDGAGLKRIVTDHVALTGRENFWRSVLASARIGGTAVLGWLWNLILIPVVLFYLLLDWPHLLRRMKNVVPRRWAAKTFSMAAEVNAMLAQYLRGQLLVMLILSGYYSGALMAADYNVALPVGLITGMLAFIPYIGYCIGLILAAIATLLQFGNLQGFVILAIIYGFGTVLEGFILTPKLVGERIQLHPLMVIFALLAFAQLFGFVGVLLALPSSAILSVAFKHMSVHYFNSNFYNS